MFDVRRHYLKEKVRQLFTGHINKTVKNPETAKKLTPTYDMGCKRITPSDTYLQVHILGCPRLWRITKTPYTMKV